MNTAFGRVAESIVDAHEAVLQTRAVGFIHVIALCVGFAQGVADLIHGGCRIRSLSLLPAAVLVVAATATANGHAATYYVRNGGNDAGDGLTHDTAWQSLAKINGRNFSPGDDVLFLEGNAWAGQLRVNWSGTPDDAAIVGAYHLENGIPVRGARAGLPIIDGTDTVPQQFDGLVRVRGDHVRVENLSVINSEGRAIQFENADYGVVSGCETRNSYKSGIKFVGSDHALAENNLVTRAGVAWPEVGGVWGGAIELVGSNDGVIRGNEVLEVYGEGINANHGSARSTIEDNHVFAARAVGIYVDAAPNTTVRRNVVIGTTNTEFWRTARSVGAGIAINNEDYHYAANGGELPADVQSRQVKVYQNLVAGTSSGIGIWGQFAQSTFDDVFVFNNTLVDNETQLVLRDKPKNGSKLINNILLSLSPDTEDIDGSLAGMTARCNYLSRGDPGGDLSGVGSLHTGLSLTRMSGWRAANDAAAIDWSDFAIRVGSSAIGAGDEEPRSMSQGANTYDVDFNSLPHNAAMDLGALRFSATPLKRPKKPGRIGATP
jgi:parallel beta-helix repeat protein